jgi:outer membrane protein assembly factor BamA
MHLVSLTQAAGVGVSSAYGAQLVGGASFLFSDVLGNNLLSVTAQANGGVRDIGAQAFYLNRENRWYWGIEGGVIPLASVGATAGYTVINGQTVFVQSLQIFRQTNTEAGFVTSYPLSKATRVEFSAAGRRIGFSQQLEQQIYDLNGNLIADNTSDVGAPEAIRLFDTGAAWIHDTAAFGGVGPVRGQRTRVEVSPAVGDINLTTLNVDYRQYFMPIMPISFAVRGLHLGRYGSGAEDARLSPLYLGYPSLVRGYDVGTFTSADCTPTANGSCPEYDRLLGSRILVGNFEVRAPIPGLFKHSLSYGPVPLEIFGFMDAGLAWYRGQSPTDQGWATSAGFGARVNVFGYLIAEGDVVKAFNRNNGFQWVFLLRPSW